MQVPVNDLILGRGHGGVLLDDDVFLDDGNRVRDAVLQGAGVAVKHQVKAGVPQGDEIFVFRHKIGLATQFHHDSFGRFQLYEYPALACFPVFTFFRLQQAPFLQELFRCGEITLRFHQRFFAFHYPGLRLFPE